jgi:hypothetical protein
MEPSPDSTPATITFTYNSADFTMSSTDSLATTGTNPFDRAGVMSFSYPGGFHNIDKSIGYSFTPAGINPAALVTVTVQVDGQTASETFPIAIVS